MFCIITVKQIKQPKQVRNSVSIRLNPLVSITVYITKVLIRYFERIYDKSTGYICTPTVLT